MGAVESTYIPVREKGKVTQTLCFYVQWAARVNKEKKMPEWNVVVPNSALG